MISFELRTLFLIFSCLLIIASRPSSANNSEDKIEEKQSSEAKEQIGEKNQPQNDLEIYQKLFMEKRGQHYQAVRSLMESYDYEKTYKMIDLLLDRMRTVIAESKQVLKDKGFEVGMQFPKDEETREAVSILLENAALLGDLALTLPDITHKVLKSKKSEARETLKSSISFGRSTGFYDDIHSQLMHLAAQELELVPKEPDYFNPYKQENQVPPPSKDKKKKEKKEIKRGPRVSKSEL